MPRSFYLLLCVQFVSTLADNAFLIVAIARVIELAGPDWLIPVLKLSFTLSYVVLAPYVGPFADSFPKGRLMLLANFLKVCAVGLLMMEVDPVLCIGLAGLGASVYAPAKYGLITEIVATKDLVKANGLFEGGTVSAVILGTALGGFLISSWVSELNWFLALSTVQDASTQLVSGMIFLLVLNALATLMSLWIADSGARYEKQNSHPLRLVRSFLKDNQILWRDPLGGLSMWVTTLLWGVGATLQLIVLRWANESLGLPLAQAAYLQGITAIGVVGGAALASRWVPLARATGVIPLGIAMGLLLPLMLVINSVAWAAILMIVIGALAGFFLVPMNALLQYRGCTLLTAGRSIAVQGFNENAGMLLMLAIYAVVTATGVSLNSVIGCFSALVVVGMSVVYFCHIKMKKNQALCF